MKTSQAVGKQAMKMRYGVDCVEFRDGILVKEKDILEQRLENIILKENGLFIYIENSPVKLVLTKLSDSESLISIQVLFSAEKLTNGVFQPLHKKAVITFNGLLSLTSNYKLRFTKEVWLNYKFKQAPPYFNELEDQTQLLCPFLDSFNDLFDWNQYKDFVQEVYEYTKKLTDYADQMMLKHLDRRKTLGF